MPFIIWDMPWPEGSHTIFTPGTTIMKPMDTTIMTHTNTTTRHHLRTFTGHTSMGPLTGIRPIPIHGTTTGDIIISDDITTPMATSITVIIKKDVAELIETASKAGKMTREEDCEVNPGGDQS